MTWSIKQTEPPAAWPVSLDDVLSNSHINRGVEDALIDRLIRTATEHVESVSWRALITQTFEFRLDRFPSGAVLAIPRPPLQSITSIEYTRADGTTGTVVAADYVLDTASTPGRVALKDTVDWSGDDLAPVGAVVVTFVAGYGDLATDVPERYRRGIAMLAGFLFENRELPIAVAAGAIGLEAIIGDRVRAVYGE